MTEPRLQEFTERQEAVERLLTRSKLDEQVDVTIGAGLVPQDRPKDCQTSYTELQHLSFDASETGVQQLASQCVCSHESILAWRRREENRMPAAARHTPRQLDITGDLR
jgi:hypothetical protein